MADSTASIRSIYSGKGEFSDGDFDTTSGNSQIPLAMEEIQSNKNNIAPHLGPEPRNIHESTPGIGPSPGPSPVSGVTDPMSYHYREGSMARPGVSSTLHNVPVRDFSPVKLAPTSLHPGPPDWFEIQFPRISSTNVSIASSTSEYHSGPKLGRDLDESEAEYWQKENSSRPLSQNSTTSAFSTTATKDGIEGKWPYRYVQRTGWGNTVPVKDNPGSSAYQNQPNLSNGVNSPGNNRQGPLSPGLNPPETPLGPATTLNGLRHEIEAAALPPISLDEKIDLMNREPGTEEQGENFHGP
ncbi:hypothetical protein JCM33374_g3082 [Metschnikowia sp. JCM 33374]|nr:hypothetical protein JCM33374_g3082 [Metschnikowia sp. JCM 33374]